MEHVMMNPFEKFHKEWALVTSGTEEKFNSMTISWGSVGTLWSKPIVTIYIRPERYTYEFLKENDTFTVSFYGEEHRKALEVMGFQSGRDINKAEVAGLTPKFMEHGITYEEAKQTLVCKKIYVQQLNWDDFPEDAVKIYEPGAKAHYMFIGELLEVV